LERRPSEIFREKYLGSYRAPPHKGPDVKNAGFKAVFSAIETLYELSRTINPKNPKKPVLSGFERLSPYSYCRSLLKANFLNLPNLTAAHSQKINRKCQHRKKSQFSGVSTRIRAVFGSFSIDSKAEKIVKIKYWNVFDSPREIDGKN